MPAAGGLTLRGSCWLGYVFDMGAGPLLQQFDRVVAECYLVKGQVHPSREHSFGQSAFDNSN